MFGNSTMLISYDSLLPPERFIYCCFAFRNLYHCQGGLSAEHFTTTAALWPSPKQSSSNQCKQSGQLIFCIDLLTRDSSQITFLCPESLKGVLCNTGLSDHASHRDYGMSSLYQMKYDFGTINVTFGIFPMVYELEKMLL